MAKPIRVTVLGDVDHLSRSLNTAGNDVSEFSGKVGSAASNMVRDAAKFAAVGIAAGGLGTAITDAIDQAQISGKLGAQLGATAEQARQYGETAGSLYAKGYGESVQQVSESIRTVIQNIQGMGNASTSELERISGKALNTATIMDQELGGVTSAVGQLMKTGLAANADEAFDIITAGYQHGADKAGDLLDTVTEYSTQFRDLGLTGTQAMGILSQGLQAGARDADTVADALKEFAIRAKDGSKTTADGFAAIGLSASDMARRFAEGGPRASEALDVVLDRLRAMPDPVTRSQTAVALFGTKAEDLQQALFALDPSSAVAGLGNVAGAADRAGNSLHDNAGARLDTFVRSLQQGFVNVVGTYVLPLLERLGSFLSVTIGPVLGMVGQVLTGTVIPALSAFADWVGRNSDWLSIVAGVISAVFIPGLIAMGVRSSIELAKTIGLWVGTKLAALGSIAAQSGVIIGMIGRYIGLGIAAAAQAAVVVGGWIAMGAQALIQAARMAAAWVIALGPIGWVIAAVAAVVAAIVANWDTIVAWTKQAWQWIVDAVTAVAQWIWDYFLRWTLPGLIIEHWDTIVAAVRAAVRWVIDAVAWLGELPGRVGAWFRSVYDGAVGKLGELVAWLRGLPRTVLDALGDFGNLLLNVGRDLLSGLWNGIQNAAAWLRDKIVGFFKSLIPDWIKNALGIHSPSKVVAAIGRWIPPGLAVGIEQTAQVATSAADAMAGDVTSAISGALSPNMSAPVPSVNEWKSPRLPLADSAGGRQSVATFDRAEPLQHSITVNVRTNADAMEIGREIAWAMRNQGR